MWTGWSKDDALKRKGNLKETQTRELELLGLLSAVLASIWARFVALTPDELEGGERKRSQATFITSSSSPYHICRACAWCL